MSMYQIFSGVFGQPLPDRSTDDESCKKAILQPFTDQVRDLKIWLSRKFDVIANAFVNKQSKINSSQRVGRLGPECVLMVPSNDLQVKVSDSMLNISGLGRFVTVKSNVCVFGGKWMFEVELLSKGIMQLGWCSNKCKFDEYHGTGDTSHSYGYNGFKKLKWHIGCSEYGKTWRTNDIITVCLDCIQKTIEFYQNGESLGVAFENVTIEAGLVYYPAISLARGQEVKLNFGDTPFEFAVPGYQALHVESEIDLAYADFLVETILQNAKMLTRPNYAKPIESVQLSKLLKNRIVIIGVLLPSICLLTEMQFGTSSPTEVDGPLTNFLSLLWGYLENDEVGFVLNVMVTSLLKKFFGASFRTNTLSYKPQTEVIFLLNSLCCHTPTKKFLIENKFFNNHCLAYFLSLKPIGLSPEIDVLEMNTILLDEIQELYAAQKTFLQNLIQGPECPKGCDDVMRNSFTRNVKKYIMNIFSEYQPVESIFIAPDINYSLKPPVVFSFFFIMLDAVKTLLEKEGAYGYAVINPVRFFNGKFQSLSFDRIGGDLLFLTRSYRNEMYQVLDRERLAAYHLLRDSSSSITAEASTLMNAQEDNHGYRASSTTQTTDLQTPLQNVQVQDGITGASTSKDMLYEILDALVLYYYFSGHNYITEVQTHCDKKVSVTAALSELREIYSNCEELWYNVRLVTSDPSTEFTRELTTNLKNINKYRRDSLMTYDIELGRKQIWYKNVMLHQHRRDIYLWFLGSILSTLTKAADLGFVLAFVPEVYVNILPNLLDVTLDYPFSNSDSQKEVKVPAAEFVMAAQFLLEHSEDTRVIVSTCRNSIFDGLGMLVCHKEGLVAMESSSEESQLILMRTVLKPLQNRAWGPSVCVLLRFWLGDGFGFKHSRYPNIWQYGPNPLHFEALRSRYKTVIDTGILYYAAPPLPSKHFQQLIAKVFRQPGADPAAFASSVLTQLNWAFSEFIVLLLEIRNVYAQKKIFVGLKQLRVCCICFELSVNLLRVLEMVVTVIPDEVIKREGNTLLTRICQLLSQILSRTTTPPGSFQYTVDACIAGLNTITHFPIISAAIGLLIALVKDEIIEEGAVDQNPHEVSHVVRTLLTEPNFQIENLEFALGYTPEVRSRNKLGGNFDAQMKPSNDPETNKIRVPFALLGRKPARSSAPILGFSLSDYPTQISNQDIQKLEAVVKILRKSQMHLSEATLPSDDSLCPICCANRMSVKFLPCNHQSCRACILLHLVNSPLCFFCKALITHVLDLDDNVIYTRPIESIPTP